MLSARSTKILSVSLFASLLLWGGFVFVMFAGANDHFSHLLSATTDNNQVQSILTACPSGGMFCQGLHAFLPILAFTVERAAPFLWYVALSILALALWLGGRIVVSESGHEMPRLRAWWLLPIFLGAIWLLFTTLAGADVGHGAPLSRLVDPSTPEYAQQVDPEVLKILKASFSDLQQRGCLSVVNAGPLYDIKMRCVQESFFTLVLPAFLFILLVAVDFVLLGSALAFWLKLRPRGDVPFGRELLLSLGLGIGGVIVVLWSLAVAGLVIPAVGWVLLLGIPVLCYRQILSLWPRVREVIIELPAAWGGWPLVLGWVLIGVLALNFLSVIRPFPIGWDDLGSYLNRPHLLVEYGHFIPKMPSFQWEYVTSLGFLLFGTNTAFGAVAAMLLNWLAGLLAVLSIIGAGRLVLKRGGLLTGVFYYLLPVIGHFSFADMKIDNALFLMSALSFICIFSLLFTEKDEHAKTHDDWRWALLGGIFIGLAFGFKVTAAMSLFTLLIVIAGVRLGAWAAVSASFVTLAAYIVQGTLDLSTFVSRFMGTAVHVPKLPFVLISLVLAAASGTFIVYKRPREARRIGLEMAFFLLGVVITVLPWVVNNNVYNKQWPPRLSFTAENRLSPEINLSQNPPVSTRETRTLPADLAVDLTNPACSDTGTTEELDRYWGTGVGPSHYLLLPWRTVMNLDNGGYYVTTSPWLLVLPLILLLPAFWLKPDRRLRWLALFTTLQIAQWMFLANGVLWYGIGMFIGICILVEAMLQEAPDRPTRALTGLLIAISLITSFGFRMWQFDLQAGSLEYVIGKVNSEVVYAQTIPHYEGISQMVTSRAQGIPARPFTLRMGTFIPYFIPRNPERLPIADNQLDFFSCLAQGDDPVTITKRLQALGFNGIIFDLNTATIEQDSNGTLHQKVTRFIQYASSQASGLQAVVVDASAGIAYFILP